MAEVDGDSDPVDRSVQDAVDEVLEEIEEERHAANLELFVDLAFVFAVSQVTATIGRSADAVGFGRGVLLAWLVWWLWSQFAWMGSAVELGNRSRLQVMVLATVPLALLVATAIPGAFGPDGFEFAGAYLAVNLWTLAIQGSSAWSTPNTRKAFLNYLPLALIAPVVMMVGSLLEPTERTWVWGLVAVFNLGAAAMAGSESGGSEWSINPSHFVERHSLFVIIVLGEILVAAGAVASSLGALRWQIGLGLVAAAAGAAAYWWTYFSYLPVVIERFLRGEVGMSRGRLARDVLTFLHFPLILAMILYAVAVKHAVAHPTDVLDPFDRFALAASASLLLGGFAAMQLRVARWVSPERIAALAVGVLWAALGGGVLPAWLTVVGVAGIALVAQVMTVRRLDRTGFLAQE